MGGIYEYIHNSCNNLTDFLSSTLIFPSNKKGIVPLNNRVRKNVFDLVPCIHGARLSESARTAGKTTQELLDFSVNINPLGPPKLRSILSAACKDINNYPDNRYPGFKKAAADYLGVASENIVPGNGSSELIRLFAETVIEPLDLVIIPAPTFAEYEFQCRLLGARIENVNYDDLLNTNIDNCKAVFLCNPNNPTGKLLDRKEVLLFAEKCTRAEVFLFVDEAFIELADPGESIADVAAYNDFVIVLRSLTKTFAVPGLRIGFAVASPVLAGLMNNIRLHWNMNSIAAAVGEDLLADNQDYINRSLGLLKKEREWLTSKLASVRGFKPYPSDTNFILVDIREFGLSSLQLTERMLRHGIIIRDCASFDLENHIRVAVRKRSENRTLIAAILARYKRMGKRTCRK